MNEEEEQELQGAKVVELLNEISLNKPFLIEKKNFLIANMLGRCYDMLTNLHITNTETVRENRLLTDHKRLHFAGMAMQALIASDGVMNDTVKEAYLLADSMVEHSKKE